MSLERTLTEEELKALAVADRHGAWIAATRNQTIDPSSEIEIAMVDLAAAVRRMSAKLHGYIKELKQVEERLADERQLVAGLQSDIRSFSAAFGIDPSRITSASTRERIEKRKAMVDQEIDVSKPFHPGSTMELPSEGEIKDDSGAVGELARKTVAALRAELDELRKRTDAWKSHCLAGRCQAGHRICDVEIRALRSALRQVLFEKVDTEREADSELATARMELTDSRRLATMLAVCLAELDEKISDDFLRARFTKPVLQMPAVQALVAKEKPL